MTTVPPRGDRSRVLGRPPPLPPSHTLGSIPEGLAPTGIAPACEDLCQMGRLWLMASVPAPQAP